MSEVNRVSVEIMGEEYNLRGYENSDYIRKVANMVHQRMGQIAATNPKLPRARVAVLAAITLADDFTKLQQDYQQLLQVLGEGKP